MLRRSLVPLAPMLRRSLPALLHRSVPAPRIHRSPVPQLQKSLVPRAAGPFARIIAQVVLVAGSAIGRAAVQAYREAAKNGQQAGGVAAMVAKRRMSIDEAQKVLDLQSSATAEEIEAKYEVLHTLNAPTDDFAGSPYLQKKFSNAKTVLLDARNGESGGPSEEQAQKEEQEKDAEEQPKGGGRKK